jgi:hypothetical protein
VSPTGRQKYSIATRPPAHLRVTNYESQITISNRQSESIEIISISLKTNERCHFYSTIIWGGSRMPVIPNAFRAEGSFLDFSRATAAQNSTNFYSTMTPSRNRPIYLKTNDRCHFYSTMKPGGALAFRVGIHPVKRFRKSRSGRSVLAFGFAPRVINSCIGPSGGKIGR